MTDALTAAWVHESNFLIVALGPAVALLAEMPIWIRESFSLRYTMAIPPSYFYKFVQGIVRYLTIGWRLRAGVIRQMAISSHFRASHAFVSPAGRSIFIPRTATSRSFRCTEGRRNTNLSPGRVKVSRRHRRRGSPRSPDPSAIPEPESFSRSRIHGS